MADIFQCPRCGAVTYREGITIHDRYHEERDRAFKQLQDDVRHADAPQLRNWPTQKPEFLPDEANNSGYAVDEPQPDTDRWPAGI